MNNTAKAVQKTRLLKQEDIPTLGYACWWMIREHEVRKDIVEAALKGTFGLDYLPSTPQKKRAVRLALEAAERQGEVTRLKDTPEMVAYILTKDKVDEAKLDLSLDKVATAIWHKDDKKLEIRNASPEKQKEIVGLFEKYQTVYTAGDTRGIVQDWIWDQAGVSLRQTGGIYFLTQFDAVKPMKDFFEKLEPHVESTDPEYVRNVDGPIMEFFALPVTDGEVAKSQMFDIVLTEIKTELADSKAEAQEMIERYNNDETVRDSAFGNRLAEFARVRAKCELFAGLLKNEAKIIETDIESIEKKVLAILVGEDEDTDAMHAYPLNTRVMYVNTKDEDHMQKGTVLGYDDTDLKVMFDYGSLYKLPMTQCRKLDKDDNPIPQKEKEAEKKTKKGTKPGYVDHSVPASITETKTEAAANKKKAARKSA